MFSLLFYLFLVGLCIVLLVFSLVALVVTYPFEKSRRLVHHLSRLAVYVFYFAPPLWRRKVSGLENVDSSKTYVIVLNHQAMTDIPTLYYVPLNFRWVSKREVFKIPFFGQFLRLHGDICINRGNATAAMDQLLRDGKLWINRGASVAIFPEGTRSKDGQIRRFKAGAFLLAQAAQVAILPVVIDGTASMMSEKGAFSWRSMVKMKVLPPIPVEQVLATEPKEMAERVHALMSTALADLRNETNK